MKNKSFLLAVLLSAAAAASAAMPLQPLADKPGRIAVPGLPGKVYYVPSTVDTIQWGYLPNATVHPLLTVPSGATVVFDTLSHEGLLEDQGRDALGYFMSQGVPANKVLKDAIAITRSPLSGRSMYQPRLVFQSIAAPVIAK